MSFLPALLFAVCFFFALASLGPQVDTDDEATIMFCAALLAALFLFGGLLAL